MGRVVYVTGAPASGKSTTLRMIKEAVPKVTIWEYGARLTDFLRERGIELADQDELRTKSSRLAIAQSINDLDDRLLEFVEEHRLVSPVLIDSHPVTLEHHGFRVTAFSLDRLRTLAADEIWCLYTAPEVAVARIADDPRGRPLVDVETARMHTTLQASVAATYGIAVGCPVYMFDTDREQAGLVAELRSRIEAG